jgi:hypothetical protein
MATDNITPIFAPDVITQQQQLAQQQALAQALMQQGMQDTGRTQMAGNVAIRNSPVGGIANMLSAYLGGNMMNKNRQQQAELNRGQSERMLGMFGANLPTGSAQPTPPQASNSPTPQALGSALAGNGTSPLAQPSGGGPLSMPGSTDPRGDAAMYAADPKGYITRLIALKYPQAPQDQRIFEWLQTQPKETQEAFRIFKQAAQAPYNTPIQTSTGFQSYNNRTGAATPLLGANGQPLLPVPADPTVQGNVAQARAVGTGTGEAATIPLKAQAEKASTAQLSAPTALSLFDDFEKAIMRQPATMTGRGVERAAGIVGLGNEDQQTAIAEGETIASQLMAYAEKLPGPASDKDRIDFKASIGAYADATATKAQRLAAMRQARKSFERMVKKYGGGAPASGTGAAATPQRLRFNPATGDFE